LIYPKQFTIGSLVLTLLTSAVLGADHQGIVRIGEVPVPGASVQATQGTKVLQTVTDVNGRYVIPEISDGTWAIQVEFLGFETAKREVVVSKEAKIEEWGLKMQPLAAINGAPPSTFTKAPTLDLPSLRLSNSEPEAASRLLINGSVSNGATTNFALQRAFGNVRRPRFPYRFNLGVNGNNSLLDARSFSLTGQDTPRPNYSRLATSISVNGPFIIPGVFRMGTFTATYNRTQNRNASVQTTRMPTAAERAGDFSSSGGAPIDPITGMPFASGVIPQNRISPQALALMNLYPLPNFDGGTRYNYQVPIVGVTHGDNLSGNIGGIRLGRKDQLSGTGNFSTNRTDSPDLFGFTDAIRTKNVNVGLALVHRFTNRVSGNVRYQFTRSTTQTLPYFGNRVDVSGNAGVTGADRDPRNWGPPGLTFASGIARLATGSHAFDRNQSSTVTYTSTWIKGRHSVGYGVDYKWQQFNLLSQREARGNFTFTGAATGNDFADFLLGIPTASSLAFGNADKYFRQHFANAYVTDDFRLFSKFTINAGVRWEYESPINELQGRLVNLSVASDFSTATPIIAGSARNSLVQPDKGGFGFEPRIGLAFRPWAAKSMVVRAGYGVYRDTNVYRTIADQMAQQSPLSKSLSVQNTPANPLTLADGFRGSPSVTATTFAIDPRFKVGNAQNWNLAIQQDLPLSMQVVVTYLGIKGTHVPQRWLPNTIPAGAAVACTSCPTGFTYLTSNGNTNRHSGSIEIRRRQRNGFEASAMYTFSKAIDDAGLGGGNAIVQNWQDRRAERGLSNFDQRHQLTAQGQYTTGMLSALGSFWDSWRGALLRQWTISGQLSLGSGLPLTPVILAPVKGTGVTGTLRPNLTGAPIYLQSGGAFLNPAAFTAPGPGEWGNAARNSITGPGQLSLNASLTRSFKLTERVSMDLQVNANNVLNHVTFPRWNTIVNSGQFGLPTTANGMRTLQPSVRMRF
jgi:hypothetical protein